MDEEVGDEGGVEGAGAEGDEVGFGDGVEGLGEGFGGGGVEHKLDDAFFAGSDAGLAFDEGAVVHAGGEGDVGVGGGEDASAGGEDLGGHLDGLGEVSGDVREGGDEEVAEAVAFELALAEAELEELGEEMLVFGEGDHAVADVAGREHLEVFAETAGGAAVVGDGDYSGEVADDAGEGWAGYAADAAGEGGVDADAAAAVGGGYVVFEAAEEGGESGASADGYYAQGLFWFAGGLCVSLHVWILNAEGL